MKVNVTYSINLDDIPRELSRKFEGLKQDHINMTSVFDYICDDLDAKSDPSVVFKNIEKIREEFLQIDQSMAEYTSILAEYQKATAELVLMKQENIQTQKTPYSHSNQQLEADVGENSSEELDYDHIEKGLKDKND